MASTSAHFNLTKPATTDYYNIGVFNDNTDIIDTQMYNNQVSAAKIMVGATANDDGESGRVPVPHAGDQNKYLCADGTWKTVGGGGGGSTVTITPTLSSGTKIADYSIDGVSDSLYAPSGGGGGGGIDYSTTEQDTGLTWINGETVYQKSFEIQITTASVSNPLIIESDASYIDALIEYSAVAKNASGYIAGTGMSASGWGFAIHRNPSNQLILYGNAIEIVGGTAYVTIKYTKVSS